MKNFLFLAATLTGCAWTTFDDLSDSTPVRAQERPDGVKASDYGVAIVGVTATGDTSGGKVGVVSSGPGNYSVLELDPDGKSMSLGDSESLGVHTIDSLTASAAVLFDGTQVALIDNSNSGTVVGITGTADGLSLDQQIGTASKPDATAFANGEIVVAAVANPNTPKTLFTARGTSVVGCIALDNNSMSLIPAAAAINGTNALIYTTTGALLSYTLASIEDGTAAACVSAPATPTGGVTPATVVAAGLPAAMNGGHIDVVNDLALVTTYDSSSSSVGTVTVVNLAAGTIVGTNVTKGVRSIAVNSFDGQTLVGLGYPNRANASGTTAAGAVDLHTLGTDGTLSEVKQTLSIPNADASSVFGRAITTTNYNGKPIFVVAATNTVYSFYATSLYTKR